MKLARNYAAYFVLLLLASCASLPTPDTFNERLAVAISAVTAVRTTTTALLQAKKITPDDAQNVQDGANTARAGIEVARTMAKVNVAAADNRLTAVSTALTALNAYLATRQ